MAWSESESVLLANCSPPGPVIKLYTDTTQSPLTLLELVFTFKHCQLSAGDDKSFKKFGYIYFLFIFASASLKVQLFLTNLAGVMMKTVWEPKLLFLIMAGVMMKTVQEPKLLFLITSIFFFIWHYIDLNCLDGERRKGNYRISPSSFSFASLFSFPLGSFFLSSFSSCPKSCVFLFQVAWLKTPV